MGKMKRWDEEEYRRQMTGVQQLYEACRDRSNILQSNLNMSMVIWEKDYDPQGVFPSLVTRFKNSTARLNELNEALKTYWDEYQQMLTEGSGKMEQVEAVEMVYGTFGEIYSGAGAGIASAYATASFNLFNSAGYSFTMDFNDGYDFSHQDKFLNMYDQAQFFNGAYLIKDWFQLTVQQLSGSTEYADKILLGALAGSLANVSEYGAQEEFELLNWDGLSDALDIPGLEEDVEGIIKWWNKLTGLTEAEKLAKLKSKDIPEDVLKSLNKLGLNLEHLGHIGEFLDAGMKITEALEWVLNTKMHIEANHDQQIGYLESIQDALTLSGHYAGSGLYQTIEGIKQEFEDAYTKATNDIWDEVIKGIRGKAEEVVMDAGDLAGTLFAKVKFPKLTDEITVLRDVNLFYDTLSFGIEQTVGEDLEALNTFEGVRAYSNTLIQSYEHHVEMINAGVASAEDIKRTENLFQLIRSSKIQEYEAIKTMSIENDEWYTLAQEKIDLLNKYGSGENPFSGSGSFGGGQRF